jgi:hypothetical protein
MELGHESHRPIQYVQTDTHTKRLACTQTCKQSTPHATSMKQHGHAAVCVCVHVCVCLCICEYVCVCVHMCQRERGRQRECVHVRVCERQRESACVRVCVRTRERERESARMWAATSYGRFQIALRRSRRSNSVEKARAFLSH